MHFLALSNELLSHVAAFLEEKDLNNLTQTNRHLYSLLVDTLYRNNIIDTQARDGTGLAYAASLGQGRAVARFLALGAGKKVHDGYLKINKEILLECNDCCMEWWSPLYAAVSAGHIEIVTQLLDAKDIPSVMVEGFDTFFIDTFHRAVLNRDVDVAKLLLAHGAKIPQFNARSNDHNRFRRPLHYASAVGPIEMVQLLLDHGMCLNRSDELGQTPLHEALKATTTVSHRRDPKVASVLSARQNLAIILLLLERGASTTPTRRRTPSPRKMAALHPDWHVRLIFSFEKQFGWEKAAAIIEDSGYISGL